MRSSVLGCITDLSTSEEGRQQLFVWRSKVTKRRVLDLMVEFWDELDFKESDNDPSKAAEAQGLEALYDATVNGNLRLKIWVMLQTLDWGCDIKITAELEAKIATVSFEISAAEAQHKALLDELQAKFKSSEEGLKELKAQRAPDLKLMKAALTKPEATPASV